MSRPKAYPPHVGTIGGTIRIGHGLHLYCLNRDCQHRAAVDMAAVAARYGEDLAVAEFMARAVCSECGARWPDLDLKVWVVNNPSPVGAPRNPEGEG